jgi:hypothetical protein
MVHFWAYTHVLFPLVLGHDGAVETATLPREYDSLAKKDPPSSGVGNTKICLSCWSLLPKSRLDSQLECLLLKQKSYHPMCPVVTHFTIPPTQLPPPFKGPAPIPAFPVLANPLYSITHRKACVTQWTLVAHYPTSTAHSWPLQ